MSNQPDLGEQALDKVAEMAITNQLDEVQQVDVDVRTDPIKLVQGKVDSIAVTGEGMVMKQDLRVDSVEVSTGAVAINPLKAVVGQLELTEPADAQAKAILTEADINRALDSIYLRTKMRNLEIKTPGESLIIDIHRAKVRLLDNNQLELKIDILVHDTDEIKSFSAIAIPSLQDQGYRINLEIVSAEGQGLSLDFVNSLFDQVVRMLDLRNFDLEGVALQLQTLKVQPGELLVQAKTTIEQIPAID